MLYGCKFTIEYSEISALSMQLVYSYMRGKDDGKG